MGLLDQIRRRLAPAPVDVIDTHPPDDPNSLGVAADAGSRGPSIYFNRQTGAGTARDPSWWSSWRYPRALRERQRESFARDALIRRGLALKADAATGEGWRVDIQTDDESIDKDKLADEIQDYEDREQIALGAAIADALLRADLYKYAIIWLGIEDGSGSAESGNELDGDLTDFAAPVQLDSVKTIAWARVFDARDVDIKSFHDMESDGYGKPTAYIVKNPEGVLPEGWRSDKGGVGDTTIRKPPQFPGNVPEIEVHASRCLLFKAPDGIAVPDSMQWHFANYFSAQAAVARGATDFSIGVYKVKNWIWKARNRDQQSSIERISSLDRMKSMFNALILDAANEDYTRLGGSAVSGLEKMVNPSMVDIAAALGVPVTLFWGVSPGGFGKGESETQNFNSSVRVGQRNEIAPQLRKFHTYVLVADDGPQIDIRPESREIEFNDLSPPDESETQVILSARVKDTLDSREAGLLDDNEARDTLKSLNTASFSFQIGAKKEPQPPPQLVGIFTGIPQFMTSIAIGEMQPSQARAALGKADPERYSPDELLEIFPDKPEPEPTPGVDPVDPSAPVDLLAEGETEIVEEDEPDELEIAFSTAPLPSDSGTARELAAKLTEQVGRKIPTGRVTRLAKEKRIRAWSILGGAPLFSLREVLGIIAQENGLMPDAKPDEDTDADE